VSARDLLAALALGLALAACEPRDYRPGQWLRGERVSEPIQDWSFSDSVPEIFVETRTWYGVPHSVTTVCAALGSDLYVPSLYPEGKGFPDGKFWTRNVARDPRVRLEIAGKLYEREAVLVEDPAEYERVLAAFAQKYPFWRDLTSKPRSERPNLVILRMQPRGSA
jgi:hypothetical protein